MRSPRPRRGRSPFATRRRGRVSLAVGLVGIVVVSGFMGGGTVGRMLVPAAEAGLISGHLRGSAEPSGPSASGAAREATAPVPEASRLPVTQARVVPSEEDVALSAPFARVGDLTLRLPSADPLVVGFHESSNWFALELTPVGRLVANRNKTRVQVPPDDADGPGYLVLSSRGRVPPATSATDIVMIDDDPVLAPVTGTVSDVRSYLLYGKARDHRVVVSPTDAPDLRVVLIHLAGVEVEVGDQVVAGRTVLAASANRFSFSSQIDRETEPDRWPHVHIEVQPRDARRPGDG